MARRIEPAPPIANPGEANALMGSLAGEVPKLRAKRGDKIAREPRSCNIMLFGEQGTGKTHLILTLLEAGLKVFVLMTDFAKSGLTTVYNYFETHPNKDHLLQNMVVVELDATGVMQFVRQPNSVEIELADGTVTDIYTFDPDVLFWDGMTAYQQVDLEGLLGGDEDDFFRKEQKFDYWKRNQNATLLPLVRFLTLHGGPNKKWSKVVTTLSKKAYEYEDTGEKDKNNQAIKNPIIGTNKDGPMLHTGARKISGAGFDLMLETTKANVGGDTYQYISRSTEKMVKERGFALPDVIELKPGENFWLKYIAPRIAGKVATSEPVEASNK